MKTIITSFYNRNIIFFFAFFIITASYSQVGIGTVNPNATSLLDLTSTTQGLLLPRMTTAQRNAITTPANSLLVYDTTLRAYYYYDTTTSSWAKINSTAEKRDNFKLVKSVTDLAPELAAGGGSKYLLTSNTLYEINGTINLAAPIDLNDAYVSGQDANEDKLVRASGNIFAGTTGGSIRNITITGGGTAFNITGGGSLLLQNTIVAGMASVGTISGVGLYFSNIVQYVANTTGITYNNIGTLLLSNQGWFGNNTGTFERFTGTFNLIQKISGFSQVNGTAIGFDVSSNPTVIQGVLFGTAYTGTLTSGKFVNGYNPAIYNGFNFTNDWFVNSPGLLLETDFVASGNIYYTGDIVTGFVQSVPDNNPANLTGTITPNNTTGVNLLRVSSLQNNRLTYRGKKTRTFQINAALSVRGNAVGGDTGIGDYYAFFIRKNGTTTLTETNTLMRVNSNADISSNSISGTVELATNEYIEIWAQRLLGSGVNSITVFSLNLSIK